MHIVGNDAHVLITVQSVQLPFLLPSHTPPPGRYLLSKSRGRGSRDRTRTALHIPSRVKTINPFDIDGGGQQGEQECGMDGPCLINIA